MPRALLAFGDDGTSNPFCAHVNGYDEVLHRSWIDDVAEFSEGTMDAFRARWLTHQSRMEPREVLGSCRQKAYDPLPEHRAGEEVSGNADVSRELRLRVVEDSDLDVLFEQQADPEAAVMAAFPAREREAFDAHWAKIRRDDTVVLRTILNDGVVAGNVSSWQDGGQRLIGYWIGREYWGRGVATQALALFVGELSARPVYAHVAVHNVGSIRVLQKCGFRRDRVQEARAPEPKDGIEEFIFVLGGQDTT